MRTAQAIASGSLSSQLTRALQANAPAAGRAPEHLRAALADAANRPGQGVRASLLLASAEASGMPGAAAERLACAVEYWHLASLLLDDLPCMDDGEARRGRPCLHRLHGEPTTILTALALINRAYALVGEVFMTRSVKVRREALALVEGIMGPNGILGGQAADLAFVAAPGGASGISRIALQKTGALLWLCLALPSLWAAPGATRRRMLRRLGLYWGLAYQAINDLGDVLSNPVQMGKSAGRDATLRRPNLALALGVPATRLRVARLLRQAKSTINRLVADDPRQAFLAQWHESLFVTLGAVLSAA